MEAIEYNIYEPFLRNSLRSSQSTTKSDELSAYKIALLIPMALALNIPNDISHTSVSSAQTSHTNSFQEISVRVSDFDIFNLLENIQNDLISNSINLDEETENLLYSNLVDLYA